MTDDELVSHCDKLHKEHGLEALTFKFLKKQKGLYFYLYARGITQSVLLERLGLSDAFAEYKTTRPLTYAGTTRTRWSWGQIIERAGAVKAEMGFLPPAGWFQANGHQTLVASVYYRKRTWEELRSELGDFTASLFVESRNGFRWRSHAEASLSNFLHARGIEHRRGERYPDAYAEQSGRAYGFYDLHFLAREQWIDVEVWGDRPNGHDEEGYATKRRTKEAFNNNNANFLGIAFADCYSDARLTELLAPYIGVIEPHVFDNPNDRIIQSTHWSNADELLAFCKEIAAQMPDGLFPPEGWLRKRGKWAGRDGPVYNTASVYIKTWLGGVRNLRKLLQQEHANTTVWDREKVLAAWDQFWRAHGVTAGQVRSAMKTGSVEYPDAVRREAGRLASAVVKFADGAEAANAALGIVIDAAYRWPKDRIVTEIRNAIEKWGASPHQIIYEHRTGKSRINQADYKHLCQLVDAAGREFGGAAKVYEQLGFTPPKRPRKPRASKAA